MIDLDQLERAYRRDPSSVERLAWWLDIDCIGHECVAAVARRLFDEAVAELKARADAELAALAGKMSGTD